MTQCDRCPDGFAAPLSGQQLCESYESYFGEVSGTWNVQYEDDTASKLAVTPEGQSSITSSDEPGVTIIGRLEPMTATNSSGWQFRIVDHQVITTITGFTAVGAVKILVSGIAGLKVGSDIVIDAGGPSEENNKIKGFGSILLETPTQFEHEAGTTVSADDAGVEYLLKTQNGKLVVSRSTESISVEGSGELEVKEVNKDEGASPVAAIVAVVAILGGLAVVVASVLFCKCRTPQNIAPDQSCDRASTMGAASNLEQVEIPKLLGALQRSASSLSKKSQENSVEKESSNLEEAAEIARKVSFKDSHEELEYAVTISGDLIDTVDREQEEGQSTRDTVDSTSPGATGDAHDEETFELGIESI